MSKSKAEGIVARLLSNAAGLDYGHVGVVVKVHEGKVTQVQYSTTENTREPLSDSQEENEPKL